VRYVARRFFAALVLAVIVIACFAWNTLGAKGAANTFVRAMAHPRNRHRRSHDAAGSSGHGLRSRRRLRSRRPGGRADASLRPTRVGARAAETSEGRWTIEAAIADAGYRAQTMANLYSRVHWVIVPGEE
jgi:hypothetical protein